MKKATFILILLFVFALSTPAKSIFNDKEAFSITKAVKLGRSKLGNSFYSLPSGNKNNVKTEQLKQCDKNCNSCDTKTGICSYCKSGYYLKNNICENCPSNASCSNGIAFTCNDYYYQNNDSCVDICTNVSCANGSPSRSKISCCCH